MGTVEISFDQSRMDFATVSQLIADSYWGAGRNAELDRTAFANSVCAAAFHEGRQVGFGRAITDHGYFAYLCDVMIWPEWRGRGIGTALVQALLDHPALANVRSWTLRTSDAHGLYARFGFEVADDGFYMRLVRPESEADKAQS